VRPADASRQPPAAAAHSGLGGSAEPARVPRAKEPTPSLLAGAGLVGVALALLTERAAAREPDISWNELVLFRSRPRRALYRYALSLGFWEMNRKTTSFVVTTRRLIVERGLLRRRTRSIPLSAIVDVDLVEGLWEGAVRVSERGGDETGIVQIGPLRAPAARRLAALLAARAGA
jgi:Bacterial PH domain